MKSRNMDFILRKTLKLYYHFGVYTKSGKYLASEDVLLLYTYWFVISVVHKGYISVVIEYLAILAERCVHYYYQGELVVIHIENHGFAYL